MFFADYQSLFAQSMPLSMGIAAALIVSYISNQGMLSGKIPGGLNMVVQVVILVAGVCLALELAIAVWGVGVAVARGTFSVPTTPIGWIEAIVLYPATAVLLSRMYDLLSRR